jgi:hypothetical protein
VESRYLSKRRGCSLGAAARNLAINAKVRKDRLSMQQKWILWAVATLLLAAMAGLSQQIFADDDEDTVVVEPAKAGSEPAKSVAEEPPKRALAKDPPGMRRLDPTCNAWIDPKYKRVVLDGEVCLRQGQLEMFACLKGTKEHESILAVDCKAFVIHAALLAVGAKVGNPVQFTPEYKAATGTPIDINLIWTDAGGVHRAKAQDWIKNAKTDKTMEHSWVFAGSGFFEDEETHEKHYLAEGGDLICVSNFPSATLDLPVESSQANATLLFAANTDAIPPKGTKVRLVLTPRLDEK